MYRIENVENVYINGEPAKLFHALQKQGDVYVHIGAFRAPPNATEADMLEIVETAEY